MNNDLNKLYQRDLAKLVNELEAYPNEASIWLVAHDIKNSAGNLTLHIVGNLNLFIGVDLGDTDYKRDRDAEFNPKETLGYPMTTSYFLMHLYGHLNWHLGQINYHRRLLTTQNSSD
jgi:hypothetical protein